MYLTQSGGEDLNEVIDTSRQLRRTPKGKKGRLSSPATNYIWTRHSQTHGGLCLFHIGPWGKIAPDQARLVKDFMAVVTGKDPRCLRGLLPVYMASRDLVLVESRDLVWPLLSSAGRGSSHSQVAPYQVRSVELSRCPPRFPFVIIQPNSNLGTVLKGLCSCN